jgi:hypothetical protein
MKKFPSRIAKPEKWLAISRDKSTIFAYLKLPKSACGPR